MKKLIYFIVFLLVVSSLALSGCGRVSEEPAQTETSESDFDF